MACLLVDHDIGIVGPDIAGEVIGIAEEVIGIAEGGIGIAEEVVGTAEVGIGIAEEWPDMVQIVLVG